MSIVRGKNRRKDPRPKALKRQRDVLCGVMLSAGQCETWMTLTELSRTTQYGEASISAQLRHLRKARYGGYAVEKRRREVAEVMCSVEHGPVWEYRLSRVLRSEPAAACRPSGAGESSGVAAVA